MAHMLLDTYHREGPRFLLDKNQTELAEYFGVARPSLARSISEMIDEGIISVNKKEYTILKLNSIKELLI